VIVTVDSNVLIYAIDRRAEEKSILAADLMARLMGRPNVMLTAQALGEFVNVVRRKRPEQLEEAIEQASEWSILFDVIPTSSDHILSAFRFAERYRLQFWDAVIWQVARSAGADHLLSEDMQDGLALEGMTVIDPFAPGNAGKVAELLR
jgi:predicted nucleic acid-binding protein